MSEEARRAAEAVYDSFCDKGHVSIDGMQPLIDAEFDSLRSDALKVIANAIMHGMPVTEFVADVRNRLVGVSRESEGTL